MFEYTFVTSPVKWEGSKIDPTGYRETVTRHAEEGWRLVQVFVQVPAAVPSQYELIFERPRGGKTA